MNVDGLDRRRFLVRVMLGNRHAQPVELAADNRDFALVSHHHEGTTAADRERR
jgi:hypothetical protein